MFASQGQKRSVVLSLKLAEAALLKQYSGEKPIILLDDVLSELDHTRQEYLLNHLSDCQVIITCCDPGQAKNLKNGFLFQVENGTLERKKAECTSI
jgi:DNA replication and repair protein RecF